MWDNEQEDNVSRKIEPDVYNAQTLWITFTVTSKQNDVARAALLKKIAFFSLVIVK